MEQRNLTPGGDKNGADINLAARTPRDGVHASAHQRLRHRSVATATSSASSRSSSNTTRKVFVVGGRQFTSGVLQRNCHEFIAYENLVGATSSPVGGDGGGRSPRSPQRCRLNACRWTRRCRSSSARWPC
jgi:hypothetical protein